MIEEKQGTIAEIIFHNEENGYTVAVFETEIEAFTIVGNLPSAAAGRSYTVRGEFTVHPSYGEQFSVREFEEMMPTTKDGIREFLASGAMKGIGRKTAAAIVSKFGTDTLRVIEEEPQRLTEISGIGPKTAEKIASAFSQQREFATITMYLQQFGITANYAMKLYQVYGADTIREIEENPYKLVEDVFGIGFKKADKIAARMGIAQNDPHRIMSGIRFTLAYFAGEGNTYLPENVLCEKAGQLLDVAIELIREILTEMAFTGDIHMELSLIHI